MTAVVSLTICGETLLLHPDRAVIWPRGRAAIVADTHFGKSSVFGRNGVAVPAGTDEADRARLTRLVAAFDIRRLMVLGDFLHAPLDVGSGEARDLERWNASLADVEIHVIAGNHDRGISSGWRGAIHWIPREHIEAPFRFVHDDSKIPEDSKVPSDSKRFRAGSEACFSFSGHVHPVIALRGLRKRAARVPAFWLRARGMILPSFGSFTGGGLVAPAEGERVFAVSPERVIAFPPR